MLQSTTAIKKILAMKARKKIIQGGTGAGKTFAILTILIDRAIKTEGLEISVVSESIPHLKRGAMKDFIKLMKSTGRWNEDSWNATDRKYTFFNGSYIEFFSPEAILGARRNILYLNEANNISFSDYHQLAVRTSNDIYIDFNPDQEFWAHSEILKEPNTESLILTYKDNEARPSNVDEEFAIALNKAEKEADEGLPITAFWRNFCEVYIFGRIGNLQGRIFSNWNQVDEIPEDAKFIAYACDPGFSNDPTAVVAVYTHNKELYVHELIYELRLTNADIDNKLVLRGVKKSDPLIVDSAEPKTVEDLKRYGYSVEPAKKGPDSVRASINQLQEYKINVTKESLNLIKELRSYKWMTDKSGKALNEPCDANNHLIDALRYVALNKLGKNNSTVWDYQIAIF
jgi:phage terminase large subunit